MQTGKNFVLLFWRLTRFVTARGRVAVTIAVLLSSLVSPALLYAEDSPDTHSRLATIRLAVDDFRAKLGIEDRIDIAVVPEDSRLVSVCRSKDEKRVFVISFDANFLSALDEEELTAAVAHEFGHIWVFTHHPYLQTEALANRRALTLVSQASLDRIYLKVSQFGGKAQTASATRSDAKGQSASDGAALSPTRTKNP